MKNSHYFLILALLGALFAILAMRFPHALNTESSKFQIIYWLILLALISRGAIAARNAPLPKLLRDLGIWVMFLLVLVALYSYRNELSQSRMAAELIPYRAITSSEGTVDLKAAEDGHFYAEADVNGTTILFMIDTGATDVVLTPDDAQAIGIPAETLSYTRIYHTANGSISGAGVKLEYINLGGIEMQNVDASVNEVEMEHSLLGMSFLKRLHSYSVQNDTLTLTP